MTFAVGSWKKKTKISLLGLFCLLSFSSYALSAPNSSGVEIFQRSTSIGPYPAVILIVGYSRDRADIEKLFDLAVSKANTAQRNLIPTGSGGDVAGINENAGVAPVEVTPETISVIESAIKVSKWSNGAFDISTGDANYKNIQVSKSESTVLLTKKGAGIDPSALTEAHLAEIIVRLIHSAGMNNALAKVGSAFRGVGQSINGPWRVEVLDNSGTFAHRAVNLTVENTGIATASANAYRSRALIDPRTGNQIDPKCRGAVVVTSDATTAAGIAEAVMVLGPEDGLRLISRYSKGLIVDNSGNFLRSPGF